MKHSLREKRLTYLALANEVDCDLCTFCKFAEFSGGSVCYGDNYTECKHKLVDTLEMCHHPYGMEPGMDCWAFRPYETIEIVADIVGLMIGKHEKAASWVKKDDGTYSVYIVPEEFK